MLSKPSMSLLSGNKCVSQTTICIDLFLNCAYHSVVLFCLQGQQLRRLEASVNWQKEFFTMDSRQSTTVTEAFVRLYESDLVYRSDYLVNWSCSLRSAISDIEVEHLIISGPTQVSVPGYEKSVGFGVLTKFAYKLTDSGSFWNLNQIYTLEWHRCS